MNSIQWNSNNQSKGFFKTGNDSVKRTLSLATLMHGLNISDLDLKTTIKKCGTTIDAKNTKLFSDEQTSYKNYLNRAAETLKANPKILEYKFNQNGELETILVHSHVDLFQQLSTNEDEICEKACEVYVAVQLFIDSTYTNAQTKPKVTLTEKLSNKCSFDNTEPTTGVVIGGRKSRQRRARKTRRGRTRKSKSKTTSKTHRRRRHSRVRKHKKNTYTRRR